MLESTGKYKISRSNYKTFSNNGKGGVEGFIEESLKQVPHKRAQISWGWKANELRKGKMVRVKDKFILPLKLNVSNVACQKITEVDKSLNT